MDAITQLPDYTNAHIFLPIEFGGIRSYASIHQSMSSDEDGLCPTGEYFVYLLHYKFGGCNFVIDITDKGVEVINRPPAIEDEIINKIVEAIS